MREVMIRRKLRQAGNETQLIKVGVLSQQGDTLRVVRPGETRPFNVAAADVVEATTAFAGNAAAQRSGVVVSSHLPDSTSALCNVLASRRRPRMKHGDSAGKHAFVKGRFDANTCAVCGKSRGGASHSDK